MLVPLSPFPHTRNEFRIAPKRQSILWSHGSGGGFDSAHAFLGHSSPFAGTSQTVTANRGIWASASTPAHKALIQRAQSLFLHMTSILHTGRSIFPHASTRLEVRREGVQTTATLSENTAQE